jgi:KDO2-lipid IV(A) lauroyltransferase
VRTDLQQPTPRWHARGLNNGAIFSATYHGVAHMPRRWSYGIGYAGTWLAYHLMRDGTQGLLANLRVVRPQASPRELEQLALLTYRHYARDTIDFIRGLSMTPRELAPLVAEFDSGRFEHVLSQGRGAIVAGGHFGNWELGGVALRLLRGYPLSVVGRPESSPAVGMIRHRMRASLGIETIEIGQMLDTALQIRRVLSGNGLVAMLMDRHLGRDRVEVSFFGRPTYFLRSPAMMASLAGAPLLPCFMIRQPDDRFVAECGDPIAIDPYLPAEDAIRHATQDFASQLESRIRAAPHLWYQFYSYWGENAEPAPKPPPT